MGLRYFQGGVQKLSEGVDNFFRRVGEIEIFSEEFHGGLRLF